MKYTMLFVCCFALLSCINGKRGSGNIVSESRTVANFKAVKVSNSIDVDISEGNQSVIVEADDNLVKYIETIVDNGELKIRLKGNVSFNNFSAKVHITNPQYNALYASSSAEIESKSSITNPEKITLTANSSSKITVNIDAPNVDIDANSSADITVKGRTKALQVSGSSSGSIDANELHAETVNASASSSATIDVFASKKIDAKANSSGDITYTGGAIDVQQNISSSGTVSKK